MHALHLWKSHFYRWVQTNLHKISHKVYWFPWYWKGMHLGPSHYKVWLSVSSSVCFHYWAFLLYKTSQGCMNILIMCGCGFGWAMGMAGEMWLDITPHTHIIFLSRDIICNLCYSTNTVLIQSLMHLRLQSLWGMTVGYVYIMYNYIYTMLCLFVYTA